MEVVMVPDIFHFETVWSYSPLAEVLRGPVLPEKRPVRDFFFWIMSCDISIVTFLQNKNFRRYFETLVEPGAPGKLSARDFSPELGLATHQSS